MNEDRIWEIVRGSPESWEEKILFESGDFGRTLKYLPGNEVAEFRRIYEGRILQAGNTYPSFVSSDVLEIAKELGLGLRPDRTLEVGRGLIRRLSLYFGTRRT
jgi:hypothetical protein